MAIKNRIVAIGIWLPVLALVAGLRNSHEAAQSGPQSAADVQKLEARFETLQQLEIGAAPLFVFGDVNEDGKVDAADLALIQQLAAGQSPAAAICPAAADFNQNGKIDTTDVAAIEKLLSQGGGSPAPRLPLRPALQFRQVACGCASQRGRAGRQFRLFC